MPSRKRQVPIHYTQSFRLPPWALLAPAQRGVPFEIAPVEDRLVAREPARVACERGLDSLEY